LHIQLYLTSYANSLLSLATGRHILNGSPLAFGEGNVKGRIKNVLNYKKPRFWIIFFSIIIVVTIGIGLVANPKSLASFNGSSYRVKEILYQAPMYSFSYILDTAPQYSISSDYKLYSKQITDEDWIMHGGLYRYEISRQELYTLFNSPSDNVHEAINNIAFFDAVLITLHIIILMNPQQPYPLLIQELFLSQLLKSPLGNYLFNFANTFLTYF